jgi:hypothetical protein
MTDAVLNLTRSAPASRARSPPRQPPTLANTRLHPRPIDTGAAFAQLVEFRVVTRQGILLGQPYARNPVGLIGRSRMLLGERDRAVAGWLRLAQQLLEQLTGCFHVVRR